MKPLENNGRWRHPWAMAALLFALTGVAGSLYLSLGLGLRACPLCFYQRSFMMGTLAVLVVGLAADPTRTGLYCLLSLPLALAGWGVAAFHEYLVLTGVLECPIGLLGIGTSPAQSLVVFTLVTAALLSRSVADPQRREAASRRLVWKHHRRSSDGLGINCQLAADASCSHSPLRLGQATPRYVPATLPGTAMSNDLAKFEPAIRLVCFFGVLVAMAAWELAVSSP